LEEKLIDSVNQKEELLKQLLNHPQIKSIHSFGLWMAVEFDSFDSCKKIIDRCIENGLLTDWFLFAANSFTATHYY
ncbi:MAG: aspartate aminotransferase family protein, partial [Chitinophagaceae bacterium]